MKKICSHHSGTKDTFGTIDTYRCVYAPCYKVKYRSAINGKFQTKFVCKTHYNSLSKWQEQLKKKVDYDIQLTILEKL